MTDDRHDWRPIDGIARLPLDDEAKIEAEIRDAVRRIRRARRVNRGFLWMNAYFVAVFAILTGVWLAGGEHVWIFRAGWWDPIILVPSLLAAQLNARALRRLPPV